MLFAKTAQLKRLHAVYFHTYDILAKPEGQKTDLCLSVEKVFTLKRHWRFWGS